MDEPCSASDPASTIRIEQTIEEIAADVTVVIVTHNMQQAQRVSHTCAFFLAAEREAGTNDRERTHRAGVQRPERPADSRLRARKVRLSMERSVRGRGPMTRVARALCAVSAGIALFVATTTIC